MSDIPPGWYKDPADPVTQRYWDGEGWLGEPIPADATPPDGPPPEAAPAGPGLPVDNADVGPADAGPTGSAGPTGPTGPTGAADGPGETSTATAGQAGAGQAGAGQAGAGQAGAGQATAGEAGAGQPGGAVPVSPPGVPGPTSPSGPAGPISPTGPASPPGLGGTGSGAGTAGYAGPPAGPGPLGVPGAGPVPPPWIVPGGKLPPPIVLPAPPAPRPHGFALAPYGSRLVARIIDMIAVLLLNVVVNGWFAYQYVLEMTPAIRQRLADPLAEPQPAPERAQYLLLTALIIATALWLAYEVPALGNNGQTLGKRLMHIKVVRLESTEPLGFGRAFRRWARLGMWTPLWACCGIGLLFQLIGSVSLLFDQPLRQALHDKVARTVVVEVPPGARPVKQNGTDPTGGTQ